MMEEYTWITSIPLDGVLWRKKKEKKE